MELDLDLGKSNLIKPITYATAADGSLLHSRLGHPGRTPFLKVFPNQSPPTQCDPCIMSKHHRVPYQGKFIIAGEKLDMIHSDLSGVISPPSIGGNQYYFKITDSCTSYKFVYLLQRKDQTFSSFVKFKRLIENQTGKRIKSMVNNNGGEYVSHVFESFVKEHGI